MVLPDPAESTILVFVTHQTCLNAKKGDARVHVRHKHDTSSHCSAAKATLLIGPLLVQAQRRHTLQSVIQKGSSG